MAYDLHGPWAAQIDHNSPLYDRKSNQDYLNADWAVNYWINSGMPKKKIVLGLATYGRTFKLKNSFQYSEGSEAIGAGEAGFITKEPGFLSYYEICEKLHEGWTDSWSDEQKVPFAYSNNEWVSYENAKSLTIKAKYAVEKDLAGVMFWTIDYDDFEGKFCGQGKYPLLTAVKDQLCKSVEEKELYKQQQRQQSNAIQTDTKYQNPNNNLNKNGLNQMPVQIPIQNQYIPNNILLTSNDQSIQANSGYGNMNSNLKENTNSAKKIPWFWNYKHRVRLI
jgi:chitinase